MKRVTVYGLSTVHTHTSLACDHVEFYAGRFGGLTGGDWQACDDMVVRHSGPVMHLRMADGQDAFIAVKPELMSLLLKAAHLRHEEKMTAATRQIAAANRERDDQRQRHFEADAEREALERAIWAFENSPWWVRIWRAIQGKITPT